MSTWAARKTSSLRKTISPGEPYRGDAVTATSNCSPTCSACTAMPLRASSRGRTSIAAPARWLSCCGRAGVPGVRAAGQCRRQRVTRDEVIRVNSASSNGPGTTAQDQAEQDRVDRLGLLQRSQGRDIDVAGSLDQVDLVIKVKEKPTGNLQLGAGYSTAGDVRSTASIKQENIFGIGQLPGPRGQHQQVQRHAGGEHRRPLLDDRWLARGRYVLPHQQAVQQPVARCTS